MRKRKYWQDGSVYIKGDILSYLAPLIRYIFWGPGLGNTLTWITEEVNERLLHSVGGVGNQGRSKMIKSQSSSATWPLPGVCVCLHFLSFLFCFFSSFLPLSLSLLPSLPSSPFPFSFLWFWCFETGPHCPELTILLRQPWECITVDCHISCISFLSYSPLSSTKPRERSADTMGAWKARGGSHGLSQHIQLGA